MAEAKKSAKTSGPGVFDVAKPGKSAPASSAKPIIVTNRPVLKDPMVVEGAADETVAGENLPDSAKSASIPSGRLKIEPLQHDEPDVKESDASEAVQPEETPAQADEAVGEDDNEKTQSDDTPADTSTLQSKAKRPPEDDEVLIRQEAERQEQLDQLAESRKYYLPINQLEKRRAKHMVALGMVFIVILGLAWADIALDAGLISIPGIKAPTHFFK